MVPVLQQQLGLVQEVLLQVRHLSTYPHGAEGGFSAYVGVGTREDRLDFGKQVTGHLDGGDVAQRA